jgi:predicted metal-dependent enzyme (double-stranded beta helix superfamily)
MPPAGYAGSCPAALVEAIRVEVRRHGDWQRTAERVAGRLRALMPDPGGVLTAKQRHGDPAGYVTHLLHAEPDGAFSVAAMVWLPGQETPVHDHVTWCVTAVLQGTEYEEIFAPQSDASDMARFEVVGRSENPAGTVSGFAPPGDIHRVRNTGDGVAISMHVYGADISRLGSSIRREYELPGGASAR